MNSDGDFAHNAADYVAADTLHGMARERYVPPSLPEPVQRSVVVTTTDRALPPNARKVATLAERSGWPVRVTAAIGYDQDGKTGDVKTKSVKEPTGETTPTGRPAMKEVGRVPADPVHSFRVSILTPEGILYNAYWVNGGFDSCIVTRGRTF